MTATIDHTDRTAPVRESYARQQLLELIEDAMRDMPYCHCGTPMTVEADGDTLWLECPTFRAPSTGRLAWLRSGIRVVMHERQVIAREVGIAA